MFLYRMKRVTYGAMLGLALPLSALAAEATDAKGDLSRDINETMTAIESYSAAQKDKAVAEGEALLRTIDRRLTALEADADEASDDVRRTWQETQARLAALRRDSAEQLQDLRQASERTWVDAKHRFHSTVDELGEAFEDAAAQVGAP